MKKLFLLSIFFFFISGIACQVIEIRNCYQLFHLISQKMTSTFQLVNNISCQGVVKSPIGSIIPSNPFMGVLDGKGFTLDGLNIQSKKNYVGLFAYGNGKKKSNIFSQNKKKNNFSYQLLGCTVKSLKIINSYVSGKDYVGTIFGWCDNCKLSDIQMGDLINNVPTFNQILASGFFLF